MSYQRVRYLLNFIFSSVSFEEKPESFKLHLNNIPGGFTLRRKENEKSAQISILFHDDLYLPFPFSSFSTLWKGHRLFEFPKSQVMGSNFVRYNMNAKLEIKLGMPNYSSGIRYQRNYILPWIFQIVYSFHEPSVSFIDLR